MNPETWASIAAAVAAVAGGVWTQRAASRASHSTAVVQAEPQQRAQDLATFQAIASRQDEQIEKLDGRVDELEAAAVKKDRTLNALVRYVKKLLALLRARNIEPPAPDAGDEPELAAHGIP